MNKKVTIKDFSHLLGVHTETLATPCRDFFTDRNFNYSIIEGAELEQLILSILKKINMDRQVIGAKERDTVWENGWKENLNEFITSKYDLNKLTPKFIRPMQPIRFNGCYVRTENPNFELDYYSAYRLWIFTEYMSKFNTIYEFGCGTGFNLVELAKLYPEKRYHGLDFANSSKRIIDLIAKKYLWNIDGHVFNLIHPDNSIEITPGSLVFTIGTIEQLASKFEPFLQFLLAKKPELCLHIEPILELYDENTLFDYLAIMFHKKRGYTQGFLPRLQELETQGKIKILKIKRIYFGSLYMEGYTHIVWRPL